MTRVACITFGCKSNQYESEELMERCRLAGFDVVRGSDKADAYIVNTCTVTAAADAQARQFLRRLRRLNQQTIIVAIGCSVANHGRAYHAMPEVDACFSVRATEDVVAYLACELKGRGLAAVAPAPVVPVRQTRARALLKVQDGCDRRCTYCAVWGVRGPAESVPLDRVAQNYRTLAAYPEIMLTGIHLGHYGRDLAPQCTLSALLERLGRERGPRLRLGSLDPDEITTPIADLMRAGRLCRHLHLSMQSGSARVLAAMGRSYTPGDIRQRVAEVARSVPGIAIGADIIVGFPGETDAEFAETLSLIEELPLAYLHVFPYSPRRGTLAATMPGQVPSALRKARARELIARGRMKRRRYVDERRASVVEAVVISRDAERGETMRAVADNYLTLRGPAVAGAYGKLITALIERFDGEEVCASWV